MYSDHNLSINWPSNKNTVEEVKNHEKIYNKTIGNTGLVLVLSHRYTQSQWLTTIDIASRVDNNIQGNK